MVLPVLGGGSTRAATAAAAAAGGTGRGFLLQQLCVSGTPGLARASAATEAATTAAAATAAKVCFSAFSSCGSVEGGALAGFAKRGIQREAFRLALSVKSFRYGKAKQSYRSLPCCAAADTATVPLQSPCLPLQHLVGVSLADMLQ